MIEKYFVFDPNGRRENYYLKLELQGEGLAREEPLHKCVNRSV